MFGGGEGVFFFLFPFFSFFLFFLVFFLSRNFCSKKEVREKARFYVGFFIFRNFSKLVSGGCLGLSSHVWGTGGKKENGNNWVRTSLLRRGPWGVGGGLARVWLGGICMGMDGVRFACFDFLP